MFVSPELRERYGRVEAGEDGDGAELCRVPHELGLVVHSDNLAGVYLDKTAINGNLSCVDLHFNKLPEQARVKLGQGSL